MMTNSNFRGRGRGGRYGQSGRQNSSSSERPQCQLCGKFGHTVQVCYHRFDITFQSTQNNTTGASNSGNSNSMPAMVASSNNLADDNWYLDSGASHHLTQNVANLTNATPYTGADKVTIGNGKHLTISNTGFTRLFSNPHSFQLKKVFHVPFISANLISVAKFCSDNNALIEFHSNGFFVKDLHTKRVLAQGKLENGLYKFPVISNKKTAYVGITNDSTFQCSTIGNKKELWHHRLAMPANDIVTRIMHNCNVPCGKYKALVCSSLENQFDAKIKCLQSNNGGEFRSFISFLQESGILHRFHVLTTHPKMGELSSIGMLLRYLCLDNLTGRVYVSPHVVFDETQFPFAQNISSSPSKDASDESVIPAIIVSSNPSTLSFHGSNHSMASPNLTSALTHPTPPTDTPTTRSLREPVLGRGYSLLNEVVVPPPRVTTRSMSGITKRKHIFNLAAFKISEPTTLKQAIKDPNWAEAMQTEIAALHKNQTQDLVDPPKIVDRYKARLVARGFNQTFGLDYFETFSPVVKAATIRIVLTIALSYRWELRQLDVQNAFLNGDLVEQVYMAQPPGFLHPNHPNKVSHSVITGFNSSNDDSSMFVHFGRHSTLIVLVYVDDIIVTGSSPVLIQQLIHKLHSLFALRDLGQLSYFLGIEVTYDGGSMHLSQRKYITDLLQRTSMLDSKAAATPGTVGLSLSQFDGDLMDDVTMYRSVVGALQYATLTWPDIAFSVNKACQFMHRPTSTHWSSIKRILRYLKGTITHGLLLQPSAHFTIQAYTDADWGAQPDDRRSSSGYLVYLGNNLVSWTASKQKVVSRSSAESEYRGLAIARERLFGHKLSLSEFFHARTKHIEIDLHFIRDQVLHNKLPAIYSKYADQPIFSRSISQGDDKPDVVIG
ncbi:hypothetical protein AAG906_022764 [Vitis piasezkii]